MKAARNGVPNVSIMDGWWVKDDHGGATGWKIGHEGPIGTASLNESREELLYFEDSSSFYRVLPKVLKEYYEAGDSADFLNKSINNLCLKVPVFNTRGMAADYLRRYRLQMPEAQITQMAAYAKLYSSDN